MVLIRIDIESHTDVGKGVADASCLPLPLMEDNPPPRFWLLTRFPARSMDLTGRSVSSGFPEVCRVANPHADQALESWP